MRKRTGIRPLAKTTHTICSGCGKKLKNKTLYFEHLKTCPDFQKQKEERKKKSEELKKQFQEIYLNNVRHS